MLTDQFGHTTQVGQTQTSPKFASAVNIVETQTRIQFLTFWYFSKYEY